MTRAPDAAQRVALREAVRCRAGAVANTVLGTPENLVRIPRLQHYRITGWYMQGNEEFDGLSPRAYLQDKDWDERYRVGLRALKKFEVLK